MTLQRGPGYDREVRVMLGSALVLFVWTVVIGILNGVDVVDFDRKTLLTHLHVGTLGWIATSVFAATFYLFDGPSTAQSRALAWATPVMAVIYNIAFLTTTSVVRPALGTAMMVVMLLFAAPAWVGGAQSSSVVARVVSMTSSGGGAVVGASSPVQPGRSEACHFFMPSAVDTRKTPSSRSIKAWSRSSAFSLRAHH